MQGTMLTFGFVFEKAIDFRDSAVEHHRGETVVRSIENQVLSHDGEADETEITTRLTVRRADIDAGKTRTKVSINRQQ
jgi:hypothetical protein